MKKPVCPRCNGTLIPEKDLTGKAVSVGCAICGERFFRGVTRRVPGKNETGLGGPGVPGHRVAGGAKC